MHLGMSPTAAFWFAVSVHAIDPIEIVVRLAQTTGTVLLNGSGFDGPPWSVRVSLANLDADDYEAIGRNLRQIAENAVTKWRKSGGK